MSEKQVFSILECPDGYKIADDVFSRYGSMIVGKNTIVNEHIREKLRNFKVEKIAVIEPELLKNSADNSEAVLIAAKKEYLEGVNSVKVIINDLAAGRELDYEKINRISGSFYENIRSNFAVIECMKQIKNADEYTYSHCVNVSLYSMLIGKWLKLPENEIRLLMIAGLLHDVGKAKVPFEILNKPGPLTQKEFEVIKKHSEYGYEIIKDIPGIDGKVKNAVLMHHEKENGKGYPFGTKGADISYFAKIISIADVFDALTSERVYKSRLTPFDTFREFERIGIGEGNYDIRILLTFLYNISQYYTGSKVKMSTGKVGEIIYIPPHNISRPVVREADGYIDLSVRKDMNIVEML